MYKRQGYGITTGDGIYVAAPEIQDSTPSIVYQQPAYTSVDGMKRSDGSIGTLKIPSLGINMKVWEGETNTSMSKGLGHYSSTSAWDGNVGMCGHNRGAKYVIGNIKDMEEGDLITYTTVDVYKRQVMDSIMPFLRDTYDYIIIDCGLKHELLTVNALAASDYCICLLYTSGHSPSLQTGGHPCRAGWREYSGRPVR